MNGNSHWTSLFAGQCFQLDTDPLMLCYCLGVCNVDVVPACMQSTLCALTISSYFFLLLNVLLVCSAFIEFHNRLWCWGQSSLW
jgi:hypothetical protein